MIKIKLLRGGNKNSPVYRIIAIESKRKTTGKTLDTLGFWNPLKGDLKFDKVKIINWIEKGAKLTESAKKIIKL
jgi:small subunit ribosomal protein S16